MTDLYDCAILYCDPPSDSDMTNGDTLTTTMDDNHESIEQKRKYNRLSKTRQRARDKAILENRRVPARLKKRKRGRKRLPISDDIEVRKRRELGRRKYLKSKMTIDPQGKVITGNGVRTINVRFSRNFILC